ncbi:alpha/beta hydrolase [Paenibacillus puerhi]|uniref:alpha/beta hydrolase n=1 Tax=Paenibacillus puerhi TaxID=2692622 RepID=UPI0013594A1E|nr:alpha/beta hydrolase [Paenibacillus puerhi]
MTTFIDSLANLRDSRKVSYKIYGDENENTIIFFHGFGSSASAVHPDVNLLNKYNIRFIAVNRPGYGESEVKQKYSLEDVADDVNELLTSLGIRKVAVIGWSAGGLYSQVFADKYSDKVNSLNLVSSAIPLDGRESEAFLPTNWKIIRVMNKYIPFLTKLFFQKLSKDLSKNFEVTLKKSIGQMVDADKKIALDPMMKPVITKGAIEAYHNRGTAVFYDAVALCGKYPQFTTYCHRVNIWQGGRDEVWTLATSNYLRGKYVNSNYSIFDDEGHLLYLSKWEEILKASLN